MVNGIKITIIVVYPTRECNGRQVAVGQGRPISSRRRMA